MSESKSPLAPGLIVAETYDVERLLGQGGMGEVWLARHLRLAGKQVAIKVLHALAGANADLLARFRREAEIAAQLDHPNIVQVLDFNQLPTGEPYLVMEFLKGESLADRVRKSGGLLSVPQVQAIVLQVGSALQAAHALGVVHRDLKPDNIFLVPTALGDQVKVLDFGISKLAKSGSMPTVEQTLLGTPLYMSPEQALGQNRDTTKQSDLFSLGSICYELLTGTAPFAAESIAQVVFRIAYQPHVSLAQLMPSLPANVSAAIEHALLKDRASRTPDIGTFVRELTGESLSNVAAPGDAGHEETSGVYKPGMKVSDSLVMNATVPPTGARAAVSSAGRVGGSALSSATPHAPASVAGVPARSSPLPFVAGGAVLVALLATGGVVWQRSRAATTASVFDAGAPAMALAVVTPPPTPPVTTVVEAPDAGAPHDEVVDAGRTVTVVAKVHKGPPPKLELNAEELSVMNELRAQRNAKDWERLVSRRSWAERHLANNPAALREVTVLMLEGQCALRDLGSVTSAFRRLQGLPGIDAATLATAKKLCRAQYPEWEP